MCSQKQSDRPSALVMHHCLKHLNANDPKLAITSAYASTEKNIDHADWQAKGGAIWLITNTE